MTYQDKPRNITSNHTFPVISCWKTSVPSPTLQTPIPHLSSGGKVALSQSSELVLWDNFWAASSRSCSSKPFPQKKSGLVNEAPLPVDPIGRNPNREGVLRNGAPTKAGRKHDNTVKMASNKDACRKAAMDATNFLTKQNLSWHCRWQKPALTQQDIMRGRLAMNIMLCCAPAVKFSSKTWIWICDVRRTSYVVFDVFESICHTRPQKPSKHKTS